MEFDKLEYDKQAVAAYMKGFCGEEVELLLCEAERLMGQTFAFTAPWDMEPCAAPYTLEPMVWDQTPNGDPEWVYMLNRQDYLNRLLQAWLVTGEKRYSDQVIWYIQDWIRKNPVRPEGGETIRTIDTGIRCMNWLSLLLRMQGWGLAGEETAAEILSSVSGQFSYLKASYLEKYTLSNWGLLQTTAICFGYLWYGEFLPGGGLKEWAWEELKRQVELQAMEDGSHWEQSMMYHMEVLNSLMKLLAGCRYAGYPAPSWLEQAVFAMSRYVLFAAGPDHRQIAQADSDVTDVRDVLTKAAALCGSGELKYGGFLSMDLDSAWLLGAWGIRRYGALAGQEPGERKMVCMDTGNIYLRSSWGEDANYTYLHCGPLGSAHGHGDLVHICLYYRGIPFLADSGRYSYREEEPLRMALKEAQAHNVRVVDGHSPAVADGSWSYASYGEPMRNYCSSKGTVHFTEMSYWYDAGRGEVCLVKRRVMFQESGIWLIADEICCGGTHLAEEAWHLDSGVEVDMADKVEAVEAADTVEVADMAEAAGTANNRQGILRRISLNGKGRILNLWSEREMEVRGCQISKRYNELEDSVKLVGTAEFTDAVTDWRCFTGEGITVSAVPVNRAGMDRPEENGDVTALEFDLGTGESWVFLLWNRETFRGNKLYFCKGIPVYGRAVALRLENGRHKETLRF